MTALRWTFAVLSLLAAVAAAVYVIQAHWPQGGAMLGLPWWTHGLLLAVVAVELFFRGLKISFGARACGIPLGAGTAVRATLCGDFVDAIAPARVGAEPARFLVLREAGVPISAALVILFLELFLELIALVVIAAILMVLLPWTAAMGALATMIGVYAAFVLALAAIGYFGARGDRPSSAAPGAAPATFGQRMRARLRRTSHHLREGIVALRRARLSFMGVALASSSLHIMARLAVLPVIVFSVGAPVALTPLILWPLVLLYAAALAPAPSGGGAMEFGFSAALGDTIPPELMAAALIWWRLYSFFIYVALGALAAGRTAMRVLSGAGAPSPVA